MKSVMQLKDGLQKKVGTITNFVRLFWEIILSVSFPALRKFIKTNFHTLRKYIGDSFLPNFPKHHLFSDLVNQQKLQAHKF